MRPMVCLAWLCTAPHAVSAGLAADAPAVLFVGELRPALAGVIQAAGGQPRQSDGPLTAEALEPCSVLAIVNPRTALPDKAQIEAAHQFVAAGGSLLVVIDAAARTPMPLDVANSLVMPFGLSFTDDVPYVHNRGAIALSGPINRQAREIPYSGGRAVEGGVPFSLILSATDLAHASYVERPGGGRVIAMGEAMATLLMGTATGERLSGVPHDPSRTTYWGKDSRIFMREVFAWLLRAPSATE